LAWKLRKKNGVGKTGKDGFTKKEATITNNETKPETTTGWKIEKGRGVEEGRGGEIEATKQVGWGNMRKVGTRTLILPTLVCGGGGSNPGGAF